MGASTAVRLSGRRAEAARNDDRILAAARAVFLADPAAPVSAVAARAGVGIAALYRRYPSKEDLLRSICADGLARYIGQVETALAALEAGTDPREAFAAFMRGVVDADTHSLTLRLAGTFTSTEELYRQSARSQELTTELFERVQRAGAVRPDLRVADLSFIFEQLAGIEFPDPRRLAELRHRYLTLILDAIRAPSTAPLPGPPPTWDDIARRWLR